MFFEVFLSYLYEGLIKELFFLGMLWVVMDVGIEFDEEEFVDILEGVLKFFGSRVKIYILKMGRNDRSFFDKVLKVWFGRSVFEIYGEFFEFVVIEIIKLFRDGNIDFGEFLFIIKIDKNGIYFGIVYNGG